MMKRLIVISGPVSSGKSTLANSLSARFRFDVRRTKDWLKRRAGESGNPDRGALQRYGDQSDTETGGKWIVEELSRDLASLSSDTVIVDSARTQDQVAALRLAF